MIRKYRRKEPALAVQFTEKTPITEILEIGGDKISLKDGRVCFNGAEITEGEFIVSDVLGVKLHTKENFDHFFTPIREKKKKVTVSQ